LEERLFDRRIVLCRGILDDALAGRIAAQLMALDALGDSAIVLQLDSQGASLEAAWTLVDVIDLLGVPVNIVCAGRVEGAAVGVLAAGNKRTALPHSVYRLNDPELEISGRASDLEALLAHHTKRLYRLHERVATATGWPISDVAADVRSGRSFDATQALAYRLVDEIAGDQPPIRSIANARRHSPHGSRAESTEPMGFRPRSRPWNP
jgi:ATP-dependent Clp protease protease subunit